MVVKVPGNRKKDKIMAMTTKKKLRESRALHPSATKWDTVHTQLMDYILSGESHSTLVGKVISLDHSDEGVSEVESYVEYVISQLQREIGRAHV